MVRSRPAFDDRRRAAPLARRAARLLVVVAALGAAGCAGTGLEVSPKASFDPVHAPDTAAGAYEVGKRQLATGHIGNALVSFRQALRREPESVSALNGMAIAYDRLGRFDLARHYFERALALEPDSTMTLNNIGRSLLDQGKPDLALRYLERGHALAAEDELIRGNLELARHRTAALAARAVAPGAHGPWPPARAAWVERTAAGVQTLVTSGAPGSSASHGSDPHQRLLSVVPRPRPGGPPAATRRPAIEVSNGAGRRHMAARMRALLAEHGLEVQRLTNAEHFGFDATVLFYRPGAEDLAAALAAHLPAGIARVRDDSARVDVRLRLGKDLLNFDDAMLQRERTI